MVVISWRWLDIRHFEEVGADVIMLKN